MTGTVAQLQNILTPESMAGTIAGLYDQWKQARMTWEAETEELRNFIFATDTTKTSNDGLDWSNKTHLPKIAQIRDNLHANYLSALFPNDYWLDWLPDDAESALEEKREAILAYMRNKLREQKFRTIVSELLHDYIDYGNVIADAKYVQESKVLEDGEVIPGFIGPKCVRVSPLDIVFNPLAPSFKDSPKITRVLVGLGELKQKIGTSPDDKGWVSEAIAYAEDIRNSVRGGTFTANDFAKVSPINIEGFQDYYTYLTGPYVELLEIEGDIYDPGTDTFERDVVITVIDRIRVVRKQKNPSWLGKGYKQHVSWRKRPDNLYGMSPLANLVGLQYRINHLENSKADAIDQNIFPPIIVSGEVEPFNWGPGVEIHTDENGSVSPLRPDLSALNVNADIQYLMELMEEFAGAPREAMGIRTPGEKTKFEVQSLLNAAGRIFQEKIMSFEIEVLEPLLNGMLELARRNLNGSDLIRISDDDSGVVDFMKITKEDLSAAGKLRPIGARHFAAQAQLAQNLTTLANTNAWSKVAPHFSGKRLATLFEEVMNLERFDLVGDNIGVLEDLESQKLIQEFQEQSAVEASVPVEDVEVPVG